MQLLKNYAWKWLAVGLLMYSVFGGLLFKAPRLAILNETIRNLHFHVPMWFAMNVLLVVSLVYSVLYLRGGNPRHDLWAVEAANAGLLFGTLGILTGMIWAKFTWGSPWSGDPKQNAAAIAMLIYFAYLLLRGAFDDEQRRGRIGAIYNIFAFAAYIPLIWVLPRLTDSLHPGSGGNPGFNAYDMDSGLRLVFYPAVLGWILLGVWVAQLRVRLRTVQAKVLEMA
ncbi:MAG: cytochrome c biogenesis protein [Bernardetiaceae bacterium]|jgi:heme exporter protein C|nr:cytochrome c biogenesis protein [Bernardetiaceae bacterium]